MIVVGYQGIGKSSHTLPYQFIDLESSNFNIRVVKDDWWQYMYVDTAIHLNEQGYNVWLSSHKCVREALNDRQVRFGVILPELQMKNIWLEKLERRYNATGLEKDLRALTKAKEHFDDDIKDLRQETFCSFITDKDYSLKNNIDELKEMFFTVKEKERISDLFIKTLIEAVRKNNNIIVDKSIYDKIENKASELSKKNDIERLIGIQNFIKEIENLPTDLNVKTFL